MSEWHLQEPSKGIPTNLNNHTLTAGNGMDLKDSKGRTIMYIYVYIYICIYIYIYMDIYIYIYMDNL